MDERRGSKAVMMVMVMVMMMMIVGGKCSPLSEFERCYAGSFIVCIIVPTNTAYACSLKSLKDCIPSPPPPIQEQTLLQVAKKKKMETNYFCRLGCASSLCTNISTKHNPGGMKVANCVASCSEKCSHT